MRSWLLPAIIGATILALVIGLPIFWQWSYQERLLRAVPVGSTSDQYVNALKRGDLGPGELRASMTFCRPLNFHGVIYTIYAYPRWDRSLHLAGYSLGAKFFVRGRSWWLVVPDHQELDD